MRFPSHHASRFRPPGTPRSAWNLVFAWTLAAVAALAIGSLPARAQGVSPAAGLPVVAHVDWPRYAGVWYELARLPNSFQRKCIANVTADYRALPNGDIQVDNRCERADHGIDASTGEARLVAGGLGKLQVRFAPKWLSWIPAIWGDYWVIALDDDYRTALVGTPDRQYLWLLSRVPQRSAADIDAWLQKAAALGFDAERVLRTVQVTENPPTPVSPSPPLPEAATPGPVPEPFPGLVPGPVLGPVPEPLREPLPTSPSGPAADPVASPPGATGG